MKKLLIVILCLFLVTSISDAMGGGGGRNKNSSTSSAKVKPTQVLNPGPHLMFTSEGALAFYIDVIPAIDEPYDYEPTAPDGNETSIALGEFNLADGTFEVTIHGNNDAGNSKMITFELTVKSHGQNRTWTIVPLQEMANQDPEYMSSFDTSSLTVTVPKMIKLPQ